MLRAALLGLPCEMRLVCDGAAADSADHVPPVSLHEHVEGSGCCVLRPACMRCQGEQARLLSMEAKRRKRLGLVVDLSDDRLVQSVEWL